MIFFKSTEITSGFLNIGQMAKKMGHDNVQYYCFAIFAFLWFFVLRVISFSLFFCCPRATVRATGKKKHTLSLSLLCLLKIFYKNQSIFLYAEVPNTIFLAWHVVHDFDEMMEKDHIRRGISVSITIMCYIVMQVVWTKAIYFKILRTIQGNTNSSGSIQNSMSDSDIESSMKDTCNM